MASKLSILSLTSALVGAAGMTSAQEAPTTVPPAPSTTTVVVTGKRPDVVNKVDRKVYRADADLQRSTGSAADILSNIPSIEVDPDGNVSLRGDSSVTVLIDGKPSAQMQGAARGAALQSLAAGDIEQIEVIPSPSAEFKADGSGGIINIVTKKTRKPGTSGLVQANLGTAGRNNINVTGSAVSGPFELNGSLGLRNDSRPRGISSHTQSTGPGNSGKTDSTQDQRQTSRRRSASADVQYTLNDKQTLGLSLDYSGRDERRSATEHSVSSGGSTAAFDRTGQGGGPQSNADLDLSFEQKMAREGETLSFDIQTGRSVEDNIYDFTTVYSAPALAVTRERDISRQVYGVSEFTAAYVRPFASGSTLKLGYDAEYDQNAFDNTVAAAASASAPLVVNHASDNLFRYRQTVQAAYITHDKKWGKLEWLGGLRFEQTDIHTLQNVSGDASTQNYGQFYPTLNLLYTLSDNDTLSAGFSKRIRRRDPEDLNPYINASDPNNLRQGNPNLKPEVTDSYDLGYRHDANGRSWSLNGYYRKSRNGDTELLTVIGPDVVLIREANLPSSLSGGVEFIASGKLLPKLGYTLSGNLFYNEVNALALGAGTQSSIALNAKAALDYKPTTADRWQISVKTNGKRLTSQGYVLPVTTMNAGYRHQLNEKLAFVATVSDLFNSQRQKRFFQTTNFTGIYTRRQGGQIAYIGLTYTFGAPKKSKESDFTYDQ